MVIAIEAKSMDTKRVCRFKKYREDICSRECSIPLVLIVALSMKNQWHCTIDLDSFGDSVISLSNPPKR